MGSWLRSVGGQAADDVVLPVAQLVQSTSNSVGEGVNYIESAVLGGPAVNTIVTATGAACLAIVSAYVGRHLRAR